MKKQKNYTHICYYINGQGNEKQKLFLTVEEGLEFCRILDKRIENGTCFGYDFTALPKNYI